MNSTAPLFLSLVLLAFVPACEADAPPMINPTGQDGQLSADTSIDDILDALDQRGKNLKDFRADVTLTETANDTGDNFSRTGTVAFQRQKDGASRLHVVFDKKLTGNQVQNEKLEYLLENGWLTDRNYLKKSEVRRQILKPGEKIDIIKLGEGPFPLPIGQDKSEVHKYFDVKKLQPNKSDPAAPADAPTLHLQLIPKPKGDFARKFHHIDVWVDPKTHFPIRIETVDANQTVTRTTDLQKVQVNSDLKDKEFALPDISKDNWDRAEEPYSDK
jgi:outer membrane lipoprotein-sorting protein